MTELDHRLQTALDDLGAQFREVARKEKLRIRRRRRAMVIAGAALVAAPVAVLVVSERDGDSQAQADIVRAIAVTNATRTLSVSSVAELSRPGLTPKVTMDTGRLDLLTGESSIRSSTDRGFVAERRTVGGRVYIRGRRGGWTRSRASTKRSESSLPALMGIDGLSAEEQRALLDVPASGTLRIDGVTTTRYSVRTNVGRVTGDASGPAASRVRLTLIVWVDARMRIRRLQRTYAAPHGATLVLLTRLTHFGGALRVAAPKGSRPVTAGESAGFVPLASSREVLAELTSPR